MNVVAVLVAAGRGERLGDRGPKALVDVGGSPLLAHAMEGLLAGGIDRIVVVHPPDRGADFAEVTGRLTRAVTTLVPGGETRSASVAAGVAAVPPDADVVAVHDAARAFAPAAVIARTVAAVTGDVVAAAPGLPVPDTLKRVGAGSEVSETLDREGLWTVQTPQVVRRDILLEVQAWAAGRDATDDLGLVEAAIAAGAVTGSVRLVAGDPLAFKITRPEDLELARRLVRGGP